MLFHYVTDVQSNSNQFNGLNIQKEEKEDT